MADRDLAISARGIHKAFGETTVLRNVDLEVAAGEVLCLIGPSGSGKSTFLRCINHLETVDAGRLLVFGKPVGYREERGVLRELPPKEVCRRRSEIGMVFQRFNLFAHMTALENVAEAPVKVLGKSKVEARENAQNLLEKVGLGGKSHCYPSALSGGQQQRVAIARALGMGPRLMLFDEPTSALDPELVDDVLHVMRDLADSGMTMAVVTHEIGFAREVADTVAFMDEGRIVESGPAREVLSDPSHIRTKEFISKVLA